MATDPFDQNVHPISSHASPLPNDQRKVAMLLHFIVTLEFFVRSCTNCKDLSILFVTIFVTAETDESQKATKEQETGIHDNPNCVTTFDIVFSRSRIYEYLHTCMLMLLRTQSLERTMCFDGDLCKSGASFVVRNDSW